MYENPLMIYGSPWIIHEESVDMRCLIIMFSGVPPICHAPPPPAAPPSPHVKCRVGEQDTVSWLDDHLHFECHKCIACFSYLVLQFV